MLMTSSWHLASAIFIRIHRATSLRYQPPTTISAKVSQPFLKVLMARAPLWAVCRHRSDLFWIDWERVRRKRLGRRRAADQRDELASPHIGSQAQTTALHPLKQVL